MQNKKQVNIAIIGKYVELKDAYKSLDEALTHGGIYNKVRVNLVRIDSEKLKISEIKNKLKNISGILIPGGFGKRGTDGKIVHRSLSERMRPNACPAPIKSSRPFVAGAQLPRAQYWR